MSLDVQDPVDTIDPPAPSQDDRVRPWGLLTIATAVAGSSLAALVALDGAPGWQITRTVGMLAITAGLVFVERRAGRTTAGLVALGFGAATFSVGVGIALPHITKVGHSRPGVVGAIALLAGAVLLVAGTGRVIAPMRWRGRVPTVAGVLIGTLVLLLTLSVAVAATNVPRTDLADARPTDDGHDYEDIAFPTADGVELSGWYIPSENGAAVALLHGAGSTRSGTLAEAAVLADHGYGVLLFDARGHGLSGGRAMDFGWNGDADTMAAVSFLAERDDVDPDRIGAIGLSMGGEQALGALAADPRIHAVVAEGATGRVAADGAWVSDEYGLQGQLQEGLDRLRYAFVDLLTEAPRPQSLRSSAAAAAPRPVLLIAAGEVPDEALAGVHIQSGAPESVELWEVEGAGHTAGLATAPEKWEERVVGFLDTALAPSGEADTSAG